MAQQKTANRNRLDFSKIPATIQIPNLIEVQKRSYDRFLQMDALPERARRRGLAGGLSVGLPDHRLPQRLAARLRRVRHRQLGVQVRPPQGAEPPAHHLPQLRPYGEDRPVPSGRSALHQVRHLQRQHARFLHQVRRSGRAATEVRRGRVRRARHDLLRAAEGHHAPDHLRQGPRDRQQDHPRHEGAGGLLRRHSADDRERHLHHQRHRARDRQPVAPLARRLLRDGQQPHLLPGQDHSLPRLVGGVRVRPEEHAVCAHRPQAQVPGHDLPARPGPAFR